MAETFAQFRNANGTYDGVRMMSEISGLSSDEVRWTFDRLKHLMQVEKRSKDDAKAIVKQEAVSKPWIKHG